MNLPIDGRLTQGENIADNGGLKQAFRVNCQVIGFGLKQPFREKSLKYFLVKIKDTKTLQVLYNTVKILQLIFDI